MKDFYNLFIEEVKKMSYAERQLAKALPYFIEAAGSNKLKKYLRHHRHDTLEQVSRLEEIASEFGETLSNGTSIPMKDLLLEAKKELRGCLDAATKDATIILYIQKIKHYEIGSYGSLKAIARHFELKHILELLEESINEEGEMDRKLTEIAEGTFFDLGVNARARKRCA